MTGARYGAIFKKETKSGYRNKINTRAHLFFTTPALAVIQFGQDINDDFTPVEFLDFSFAEKWSDGQTQDRGSFSHHRPNLDSFLDS